MQSRNDVSLPLHSVLSMWAGTLPKLVTKAPEGEKNTLLCNMHVYSIMSRTAYALIHIQALYMQVTTASVSSRVSSTQSDTRY